MKKSQIETENEFKYLKGWPVCTREDSVCRSWKFIIRRNEKICHHILWCAWCAVSASRRVAGYQPRADIIFIAQGWANLSTFCYIYMNSSTWKLFVDCLFLYAQRLLRQLNATRKLFVKCSTCKRNATKIFVKYIRRIFPLPRWHCRADLNARTTYVFTLSWVIKVICAKRWPGAIVLKQDNVGCARELSTLVRRLFPRCRVGTALHFRPPPRYDAGLVKVFKA